MSRSREYAWIRTIKEGAPGSLRLFCFPHAGSGASFFRDWSRRLPADVTVLAVQPPAVVLLAGLQGAGKTTTCGKLARMLITERKKKVLTVSTDVYRPAAIEQLRTNLLDSPTLRWRVRLFWSNTTLGA